jgi:mono/diheme cytochrome c family protein
VSESSAAAAAPPADPGTRSYSWLAAPLLVFALVSLTAGLLSAHDPRAGGYFRLFFEDPIHLKAGFATAAAVLACVQLLTAGWIFRVYPWEKPAWVNPVHRWSGRLAFVATLPVAYHCIFKLGFASGDRRVFWHSLVGCLFFGAYAAKVTIVRMHRFPRPVLPIAGGIVFAALIGLWYTSALWLYEEDRKAAAAPPPAATPPAAPPGAPPPPPPAGDAARGEAVFAEAGCGACHALAAAGSSGQVGPDLDESRPSFDLVVQRVTEGGAGMPSFADRLTPAQIEDVAAFVSSSAGG